MKKITLIITMIAACSYIHAASITWNIARDTWATVEGNQTSGPNAYIGYTVFMFLASDYDAITEALVAGDIPTITSTILGGLNPNVNTGATSGATTSDRIDKIDNPISFYVVLFNETSLDDVAVGSMYQVSTIQSGNAWSGTDTPNTVHIAASSWSNDWKPVGVPEPATGMLALAGVAMLIRRRRK